MSKTVAFSVVVLLGTAFAAERDAVAQGYTFIKIADSAIEEFDPFSMAAPSLSDMGHVAFTAQVVDKSGTRVLRTGPALALPFATIVDSGLDPEVAGVFDNVSVNNSGQVSFWATISGPIDERILRGDGGPLTTIAQASDDDLFSFMSVVTSINDAGVVAWQGELNQPGFPQGLYMGDGGKVDIIFSTASSSFTSSFAGPAINEAGQIAFRASSTTSGGEAVFRYDGADSFVTIVQGDGKFSSVFDDEPDINNAGRVAVKGRGTDISTEYFIVGDGTATAVAVVSTEGPLESIFGTAINDADQIAFVGNFDDFTTQGIFTGPDLVKDRVIGTGDMIDGAAVTGLSMYREGLNNSGQIAFVAQLDDGRGVIVVASPVSKGCPADFNVDDVVNSQDFFDFLTAFFEGLDSADFNADDIVNSQDFFDFVSAFFAGC
jgi:hypothetical protein